MDTAMLRERGRLRRWELALLVGVAAALLAGVWLDREQAALSDKVIRLHVIANSDTEADQALKLRVRDRILEEAAGYFQAGQTVEEAAAELTEYLPALAEAGAQVVREAGYDYPVSASLEPNVWFPTKTYTDFSLPAGSYTALRIVIGEGEGRNWWCVVYPPLCTAAASDLSQTALGAGLTEDDLSLITGDGDGYVLRFRSLELWERLRQWLGK